jgi:hypothetical protein
MQYDFTKGSYASTATPSARLPTVSKSRQVREGDTGEDIVTFGSTVDSDGEVFKGGRYALRTPNGKARRGREESLLYCP